MPAIIRESEPEPADRSPAHRIGPGAGRRDALATLGALGVAAFHPRLSRAVDTPVAVALASSLRFAWPSLAAAALPTTGGGDGFRPTFGASRTLARQMLRGAPFELLLSADDASVALLVEAGVALPERIVDYADGKLVMTVRERTGLAGVEALPAWLAGDASRRLAIAHPDHAPYGRAAIEVLTVLSKLTSSTDGAAGLAAGQLLRGESAGQALQFFLAGAADVALLPASLLVGLPDGQRAGWRALPVDAPLHAPLRHRAVATREASDRALALLDALGSDALQQVLRAHGFAPPRQDDAAPRGPGGTRSPGRQAP